MSDTTGIEWTDSTWNPTTGCDRVSPGCDHCYAMTLAPRLKAMGSAHYQTDGDPRTSGPGFGIAMHPGALDKPLRWKKPRRIFVNSMSDLFHDGVSDDFIADVFATMTLAHWHTFQVLTKRHGRLRSLLRHGSGFVAEVSGRVVARGGQSMIWPLPNVWLGVSVENQQWADIRIPALLEADAAVRFLSMEPLLGPVSFRWAKWHPYVNSSHLDGLKGIDWVIVGGESGRGARIMDPEWVRALRDQCNEAGVAFFYKQLGSGDGGPKSRRELDGRTWDEYPRSAS